MTVSTHPTSDQLAAFGLGRLPPDEAAAIENHVQECDSCCRTLRNVNDDTLLELARAAAQHAPVDDEPSPRTFIPRELKDHPRYRILGKIGEGGMGTVYKAEHKVMARVVALKVINRRLTAKPEAVERFRREVRAAAQLIHPHIVVAHDAEEADGLHFLVMEYVDGVSLDRLVAKRGPLPVGMACHFIRQAALGLQHAHAKGLVHRDLKPHNLIVTRKGHVKVLDFGLARLAQEADADAGSATDPNLVIGTPDYLAPEQARNSSDVDGRADLYSLGCTFYFLLAGEVPFPGGSAFEKMIAQNESEPAPLDRQRPGLLLEVEAIVRKLMAKRRDDRYQTPAEVVAALTPFARQATTAADLIPEAIPVASSTPLCETETMPSPGTAADTPPVSALQFAADTERLPVRRPAKRARRARPNDNRRNLVVAAILGGVLLVAALLAGKALRGNRSGDSAPDDGKGQVAAKQRPDGGNRLQPESLPKKAVNVGRRERAALFVLPERYWYNDFVPARNALTSEGHRVVVCSTAESVVPVDGSGGQEALTVERRLGPNIRGGDFDAIVFIGGDMSKMRRNQDAWRVIEEARAAKKIIAAICTGQQVLIDAGVLNGRFAAHSRYREERYGAASGINWDYQRPIVVALRTSANGVPMESPIVTAAGPADSREFGEKLAFALARVP